jgi:hypothetical protein
MLALAICVAVEITARRGGASLHALLIGDGCPLFWLVAGFTEFSC